MGDIGSLFGFQWIAVVSLVFGSDGDVYDLPDLCIGPFESLRILKSWRRKFIKCLGKRCGQMPNIIACCIDFEEEQACEPESNIRIYPRDPYNFARDFVSDALRDYTSANSQKKRIFKTKILEMRK
ncbi:MAG: hypothetical protein PHP25_01820 [Candidatus Moranbacteria bacterium]|nr:hypothetical protein [Candidatus Moranbacteria bacterium]